jgi:hypothetical protein
MGGTEPDEMVGSVAGNPDRGSSVYFLSLMSASLKFKSQPTTLVLRSAPDPRFHKSRTKLA